MFNSHAKQSPFELNGSVEIYISLDTNDQINLDTREHSLTKFQLLRMGFVFFFFK